MVLFHGRNEPRAEGCRKVVSAASPTLKKVLSYSDPFWLSDLHHRIARQFQMNQFENLLRVSLELCCVPYRQTVYDARHEPSGQRYDVSIHGILTGPLASCRRERSFMHNRIARMRYDRMPGCFAS